MRPIVTRLLQAYRRAGIQPKIEPVPPMPRYDEFRQFTHSDVNRYAGNLLPPTAP